MALKRISEEEANKLGLNRKKIRFILGPATEETMPNLDKFKELYDKGGKEPYLEIFEILKEQAEDLIEIKKDKDKSIVQELIEGMIGIIITPLEMQVGTSFDKGWMLPNIIVYVSDAKTQDQQPIDELLTLTIANSIGALLGKSLSLRWVKVERNY